MAAGKHIYSEEPVAPTVAEGLAPLQAAEANAFKHGAVEDKIYLPGLQTLLGLARDGFFGRVTGFVSNSAGGCSAARNARASGRAGITGAVGAGA